MLRGLSFLMIMMGVQGHAVSMELCWVVGMIRFKNVLCLAVRFIDGDDGNFRALLC